MLSILKYFPRKERLKTRLQLNKIDYICTMTNISRHIEILLLKHNCVIIPNLGGFVAHVISSRYIPEEQLVLPVHRSVGFNPQLRMNDGLLVQSYMDTYGTDYQESVQIISNDVLQLKEHLYKEGHYNFDGVGHLFLNVDGHYEFEPFLSGITTPSLYGLDAFMIKEKMEEQTSTQEAEIQDGASQPVESTDAKHYTIKIKKEVVNYIAAAIVAVVFYLAWALPGHNDIGQQTINQASVVQTEEAKQQPKSVRKQAERTTSPSPVKTEQAEAKEVAQKPYYSIVMATGVATRGAQELISDMKSDGYEGAKMLKRGKLLQVVYGTYKTKDEAKQALEKLRQVSYFTESWVTQVAQE